MILYSPRSRETNTGQRDDEQNHCDDFGYQPFGLALSFIVAWQSFKNDAHRRGSSFAEIQPIKAASGGLLAVQKK